MATSQLNIIAECSTGVTTAITMCAHPNIHRSLGPRVINLPSRKAIQRWQQTLLNKSAYNDQYV
jgi:hypothetical protein